MKKQEVLKPFIITKGRSHYVPDGNPDIIIDDSNDSRGVISYDAAETLGVKNGSFCVFGYDGKNLLASRSDKENKNAYRLNGNNTFQFSATQLKKVVKLGIYRATKETVKIDEMVFQVFEPHKLIHEKVIIKKEG